MAHLVQGLVAVPAVQGQASKNAVNVMSYGPQVPLRRIMIGFIILAACPLAVPVVIILAGLVSGK